MKIKNIATISCLLLVFSVSAMADSISPTSFSATLAVGESVTVHKTVTVTEEPGTTAPVDVFFLADSTGSMWSVIASVQDSMQDILEATSGLGDVRYGVGEYRDVEPPDDYDSAFAYKLDQAITADTTAVADAIDDLAAGEGYDWPEAQLFALHEVATQTETGWRDGSTRILVWFGDAYGHTEDGDYGLADPEADAIAALQAANIAVQAIDVGDSYYGLNATGQAESIADATGGNLYTGVSSASIAATIAAAITTAIDTYNTVGLDLSEVPDGVTASVSPAAYTGDYDRSIERNFEFDVTFTMDTAGTYGFNIYGTVDGGIVATEADRLTVVPVPGAFLLGMLGLSVAGIRLRKRA